MAVEKKLEQPAARSIETAPLKTEQIPIPENKPERVLEAANLKPEVAQPLEKKGEGASLPVGQAQSYQKQRAQAIDNILSEGLNEVFLKMKPAEQKIFQQKGEETVLKINELLNQTKVKINKIVSLIRKWLSLIKGINKFFLEQEAKIKADKIIRLKDK